MFSDTDLHSHSTASDGHLRPSELLALSAEAGLKRLALTDHDTVAGLEEARAAAEAHGIELVPGVEISAQWERREIHVVGLWIDDKNPELLARLETQAERRRDRAERIAKKLSRRGIEGSLAGAEALTDDGNITRAHFARWLVEAGHVSEFSQAFRRYLGKGKSAAVGIQWPELKTVVQWIREAGGLAVVAHPLKYRLTATKLRALLGDFVEAGGHGLEVRSGGDDAQRVRHCIVQAERHGLLASMGSDFHGPTPWRSTPGCLPTLPVGTATIWEYAHRELPRAG